jgi:hypothetical protein
MENDLIYMFINEEDATYVGGDCKICRIPTRQELDKERGICFTCAEHVDDGIKYYTEEFAHASLYGKDALRLFILRQRADNCRDLIAAAAHSYDGELEMHEASVEEKMLNKRAAECLALLPASFNPWWKDSWTHEKWLNISTSAEARGWPVEKDVRIGRALTAMFVAEQHKVRKLKAEHAEVLTNIERARKEDMEAVEARCKREMAKLQGEVEADCDKKCGEHDRRGYAMGYAFADEKATKAFEAMRADLKRLTAENKGLLEQIEEDKQMVQRHLKEIAKEHAQMTAWEKGEIERLTKENKSLERRVAEESHWCKHANMAARTAEMHAQMLRTDVAELEKENEGLKKQLVAKEDMETRQAETTETLHKHLRDEMDAVDALTKGLQATREELERLSAENKMLLQEDKQIEQMVQRHLKEIVKEHAEITAGDKKEIERLTEENKKLEMNIERLEWENNQIEEVMQMLRTDVAELKKENEGLHKLVFPTLNLPKGVKAESVKLEPELAPKFPQVVQASPQLVAALKAEKTWEDGADVCYALTRKDYEDMMKAQGALPSVEVVEKDVDLDLLQKMVAAQPLPLSPPPSPLLASSSPSSPLLASDYPADYPAVCRDGGWLCCECAPLEPVAEPVEEPVAKPKRPNYNHYFWPSPRTKRFAKHIAAHTGGRPFTIKTHQDALEFIARRANLSVETILGMSMKQYQTAHEPWSLPGMPWDLQNPGAFYMK